jgi:hypothetical protein
MMGEEAGGGVGLCGGATGVGTKRGRGYRSCPFMGGRGGETAREGTDR